MTDDRNPALNRDKLAADLFMLVGLCGPRPNPDRTFEQALLVLDTVRDALLEQPRAPIHPFALGMLAVVAQLAREPDACEP